jgi:hypothetical protein
MPNATDFISKVYDNLRATFSINNTSDTILQMCWPGFQLSPADFKNQGMPDGSYDPNVATETFSALCNIAPTMNRLTFENSGCEIDDLYQILIASAIPDGTTPDNILSNPIYKLFSDAQFEFANAARGSADGGVTNYYPCKATPSDWYNEASAQFWPSINIGATQVQPATQNSPFIKMGGQKIIDKGLFRVKPESNLDSFKIFKDNLINRRNIFENLLSLQNQSLQNANLKNLSTPLISNSKLALSVTEKENKLVALSALDNRVITNFKKINATTAFTSKSIPRIPFEANLNSELITNNNTFLPPKRETLGISKYITLNQLVSQELPSKAISKDTSGFNISFKYSRVNIDRQWLKFALLNLKNWYIIGTSSGQYSSGNLDSNTGLFPLLPIAFIAIRDLKITADWSSQDLDTIQQSASIGPFDIQNNSINQNTIEVKGLQIIAWISKATPLLPPLSHDGI